MCSCDELNTPQYISHIKCPNVSNYVSDGELHAMRCTVGNLIEGCEDNRTVAVRCSKHIIIITINNIILYSI